MSEKITKGDVLEKFMGVQWTMGLLHHQRMREHGPGSDPMRGRGRIIALLKLHDGVATKEIAQIVGIRVSSLNEMLAKLEKDGLVERVQSEEDRRVMLVYLTEKGREETEEPHRLPEVLFAGFDDDELAAFDAGLEKMSDNLGAVLGEDGQELLERARRSREEFMARRDEGGWGHGPHGHGPHGHGAPHGHGPHGDEGERRPHGHGPHLCGEEGHARAAAGHGYGHALHEQSGPEARFRHAGRRGDHGCNGFRRGICNHECVSDPQACGAQYI